MEILESTFIPNIKEMGDWFNTETVSVGVESFAEDME